MEKGYVIHSVVLFSILVATNMNDREVVLVMQHNLFFLNAPELFLDLISKKTNKVRLKNVGNRESLTSLKKTRMETCSLDTQLF